MPRGCKFAGRTKGTLNKRTVALKELIEENFEGFDPIIELIEISKKEKLPTDLRVSILKNLAEYLYPKRKALEAEITADIARPQTIEEVIQEIAMLKASELNGWNLLVSMICYIVV